MAERSMKFVTKGIARAATPVAARAPPLNHELRDNAVKREAVVVIALFFLAGHRIDKFFRAFGEPDEILDGFRGFLVKEFANNVAERGFKNCVGTSRSSPVVSLVAQDSSYTASST